MKAICLVARGLKAFALAVVTPLLEKNLAKTVALGTSVVFSMARLIVLAFAIAMLRQIWHAGIAAWPEAALAIAVVLAIPILSALDRVSAAEVLDLAKVLLGRFGVGDTRAGGSVYAGKADKSDAHRNDAMNSELRDER